MHRRLGEGWTEAAAPEQVVALVLSGTRRRREALRPLASEALAATDYERLADHLTRQRLLPLVGTRLVEAHRDALPESFRKLVQEAVEATARVAKVHAMVLMQVQSALEAAGIPALPLKGPHLALAVHGNVALRPSSDLDVLVPPSRLRDAVDVLLPLGYNPPRDPLDERGLPQLHLTLGHPELPAAELHWRVHWYEDSFAADMLARSAPGDEGRRAELLDELATLLLLFARDGLAGLRMAADLAAWWDLYANSVTADGLAGVARRYPALAPALHAAAVTGRALVGAPTTMPPKAGSALAARVVPRLADWALTASDPQIAANASLIDGLLTPRGEVRSFVHRGLAPGAEVLSFREPGLAGRGPLALPLEQVQVAPRVVRRYAIALWAVRGGRTWRPPAPARVTAEAAV